MPNYVYAYATSEIDGSVTEAKFIGDQVGVRMFAKGDDGRPVMVHEWRGAQIVERRTRTASGAIVFEIELSGADHALTFEHWGGCHCHHVLKHFRPPNWTPAPA